MRERSRSEWNAWPARERHEMALAAAEVDEEDDLPGLEQRLVAIGQLRRRRPGPSRRAR